MQLTGFPKACQAVGRAPEPAGSLLREPLTCVASSLAGVGGLATPQHLAGKERRLEIHVYPVFIVGPDPRSVCEC